MTRKDFKIAAKIVALYEHELPHNEEWISSTANAVDYILEQSYPNYNHDKFFNEVSELLELLEPQED